MIIFGSDTEEDTLFSLDKNTKSFLISFFGFFPHNMEENIDLFLNEINIKSITKISSLNKPFILDGNYALQVYNVCDRRTFDLAIVLPTIFKNETDALTWFTNNLKNSEYLKRSDINEITLIDADKLSTYILEEHNYRNKVKIIDELVIKNMKEVQQKLYDQFKGDKEYIKIIKDKFSKIK